MSLFLAEIAGKMERERLDKVVDALVRGNRYELYAYSLPPGIEPPRMEFEFNQDTQYSYPNLRDLLKLRDSKPDAIARGIFIERVGDRLIFDKFEVYYNSGYNPLVDATRGIPVLSAQVVSPDYTIVSRMSISDIVKMGG